MGRLLLTSVMVLTLAGLSACQTIGRERHHSLAPRTQTTHLLQKSDETQQLQNVLAPAAPVKPEPKRNPFNVYLDPNVEDSETFFEELRPAVNQWLDYFTGKGRKWYQRALNRGAVLSPLIREKLEQAGLPEDLIYLAMIESGFNNRAYSRSHAVGTWQFMRATGRNYGLKITPWIDERRNPEKATEAAIKYLSDLHDMFDNWYLATTAYNAGENKVSRAILRYRTRDFGKLIKYRYLKSESRQYVPKLIAAAMIAKNPQHYGFESPPDTPPYTTATILAKKPVSLKKLASRLKIDHETLRDLNAELRSGITPPSSEGYPIKIPSAYQEQAQTVVNFAYAKAPANRYATYYVQKGDTLWRVAEQHDTSIETLKSINDLSYRSVHNLRVGQRLLVPLTHESTRRMVASAEIAADDSEVLSSSPTVHTVRHGENLWSISKKYRIPVLEIKKANSMRRSTIYPGQRLIIPEA